MGFPQGDRLQKPKVIMGIGRLCNSCMENTINNVADSDNEQASDFDCI